MHTAKDYDGIFVDIEWHRHGLGSWPDDELRKIGYSRIRRLDLSQNAIESIPPEVSRLVSLEELYLKGNSVRDVSPEVAQLPTLRVLDLSNNLLSSVPAALGRAPALRALSLSGNQLEALPVELALGGVDVLTLEGNPLSALPLDARSPDHALAHLRSRPAPSGKRAGGASAALGCFPCCPCIRSVPWGGGDVLSALPPRRAPCAGAAELPPVLLSPR
eukprot:tig00000851_g4906.t1